MCDAKKKSWYAHTKRALQQCGHFLQGDTSAIGHRSELVASVVAAQRDGMVSLSVDQMDCDCARWTSGSLVRAIPRLVEREIQEIYNNAEGPVYWISIDTPEAKAEYVSRDLALEAFEDGHAHIVSAVRFDEDGCY